MKRSVHKIFHVVLNQEQMNDSINSLFQSLHSKTTPMASKRRYDKLINHLREAQND